MNDKLLPCPFCGGEVFTTEQEVSQLFNRTILSCRCGMEFHYTHTRSEYRNACGYKTMVKDNPTILERWNTRKPMESIVEQLEAELDSSEKYIREYDDSIEQLAFHSGINHCLKIVKEMKENAKWCRYAE